MHIYLPCPYYHFNKLINNFVNSSTPTVSLVKHKLGITAKKKTLEAI